MKKYCIGIVLIIFFSLQSFAQTPVTIEDELYGYVLGIEGSNNQRRGDFIKDQLKRMGVGFMTAPFQQIFVQKKDTVTISGENIIVRIGEGAKKIVVGAHYDVAEGSPGANDNDSGVAVLLGLVNHLRDQNWKHSLEICFFDKEEPGCVGSANYVRQYVIPRRHLAMINLDIEGTGSELFIGPVNNNNIMMMPIVHEAADQTHFLYVEHENYPMSDYVPFALFHLEDISISVVPKGDGDKINAFVKNGNKADSLHMPQVMGVIHTPNDRSNLVSPYALRMSFEFTKTLIILLNIRR